MPDAPNPPHTAEKDAGRSPGCRWSEARQRWEREIVPGVSKEPCEHEHPPHSSLA